MHPLVTFEQNLTNSRHCEGHADGRRTYIAGIHPLKCTGHTIFDKISPWAPLLLVKGIRFSHIVQYGANLTLTSFLSHLLFLLVDAVRLLPL